MRPPNQTPLFDDNLEPNKAPSISLFDRMSFALQHSINPYTQKDLLKAKKATKFIGQGSPASSTHKYRIAAGDLANCEVYSSEDVVFVSAEGARKNRISINTKELTIAANAGVTFITDTPTDRNRPYNVGEREVEDLLLSLGYADNGFGVWTKKLNCR